MENSFNLRKFLAEGKLLEQSNPTQFKKKMDDLKNQVEKNHADYLDKTGKLVKDFQTKYPTAENQNKFSLLRLTFDALNVGDILTNKFSGTQYTVIEVGPKSAIIQQGDDGEEVEIASLNNYELNLKESYGSNEDFEGSGLIVQGRTQIDNNEIQDMMDETDFYGVWNAKEGYWFFPEDESTFSYLEADLDAEFAKRGINARFEAQFGDDKIDYDDENFSDPLIDGEDDLFEYKKNMNEKKSNSLKLANIVLEG